MGVYRQIRKAVFVSCCSMLFLAAADAEAAAPHTFHDIDYATDSGTDAYHADLQLIRQIAPPGAAVEQVSHNLSKAGARPLKAASNGNVRFVYYSTETVDDIQHDVALTILISQNDGLVQSVHTSRVSYGS